MGVHPKADLVGSPVSIGKGSYVERGCIIYPPVVIGDNTIIHSGTVIGSPPEHKSKGSKHGVVIGSNTVIGPNCVITAGTDERPTTIGDNCFVMAGVHVSHDCLVGDDVTIAHKVILAGHCVIQDRANLGSGSMVHQNTTVGAGVMVGMGSVVVKDIYPYLKVWGNPCTYGGLNYHQLKGCRSDGGDIQNDDDFIRGIQDSHILEDLQKFHRFSGKRGIKRMLSYSWASLGGEEE